MEEWNQDSRRMLADSAFEWQTFFVVHIANDLFYLA
jgi:hypothetical protein